MNAKYIAIRHEGVVEVHAYGGDPTALCGLDADEHLAFLAALPSRPRIDCKDCLCIWTRWQRFTKRDFANAPPPKPSRSAIPTPTVGPDGTNMRARHHDTRHVSAQEPIPYPVGARTVRRRVRRTGTRRVVK